MNVLVPPRSRVERRILSAFEGNPYKIDLTPRHRELTAYGVKRRRTVALKKAFDVLAGLPIVCRSNGQPERRPSLADAHVVISRPISCGL